MSVFLSFCLSGCFLGIVSLVFYKFWYGAWDPYKVVWDIPRHPQHFENGPKMGQKQGFFNLLRNLVIKFYWTICIMKIYIICCVPAQIPHLGKFLCLRYGPKCSQPISVQDFLLNHTSRTNQSNSSIVFFLFFFLHVLHDTNSRKLKVDQNFFGWAC